MTTVVFDYDPYPDMSWLEQDCYNPDHPSFEGTYRVDPDGKIGTEYDPDWYRDSANHVTLEMRVLDDDGFVVDSLCGIDFLADDDCWAIGSFSRVSELPDGYLRDLARDAGLPE